MHSFFLFLFFFCAISIVLKMSHLLSFLIGFEMLVIYVCMIYFLSQVYLGFFYFLVIFLTFSVCESVVGLILFVMFSRSFSKDYMRSLSVVLF